MEAEDAIPGWENGRWLKEEEEPSCLHTRRGRADINMVPPSLQDWVQIRILLSLPPPPASRICKVKKGPYRLQKKGGGGDREIGGGGPLGITTTVTLGKKV